MKMCASWMGQILPELDKGKKYYRVPVNFPLKHLRKLVSVKYPKSDPEKNRVYITVLCSQICHQYAINRKGPKDSDGSELK